MHRLRWIPLFVLLACASWASASANGASGNVVLSLDVASTTTLTNNCTAASATRLGSVLPGTEATTATGAGAACSVTFGSSNDTSALRLGTLDGASVAMSSPATAWTPGRTQGLQFRALDRSDANTIAMGGYWGLVTRSVNAGSSWTYGFSSLASGDYVLDIDHVPASNQVFVAVGGRGSVSSTANFASSAPANPTWVDHRAAVLASGWPAGESVTGVAVVDALTWYIAGEFGRLGRTTNGGSSFTSVDLPVFSQLLAIDALDANHIYVTGSNGRMYYTTIGEPDLAAWSSVTSPCGCWFYGVSAADATHVYLASDTGIVTRWDGSSLVTMVDLDERSFEPRAISAPASHPATVFVATQYGKVYRSGDSAATFTRTNTPVGGALRGISALDDQNVWAAGSSETVVYSTNAGASWSIAIEDTGHKPLRDVQKHPSDGQRALAVGSHGDILRTVDGAASWTSMASGTTANLNGVAWPSSLRAVAVGAGGTIVVSTDGGATWSPRTSGTTAELLAVTAGDHETLWAVGSGGTVLRSANRGDTWTSINSGTTVSLESVTAVGTQVAVVAGAGATIRRTANAGATWAAGTGPPSWEFVTGVAAKDATTIYASTLYSDVWRSTDGGLTFTVLASYPDGTVPPETISVLDETIASISRWGDVAISRDNGVTWTTQPALSGTDFNEVTDLELVDPHTFITVDDLGGVSQQDENSLAASQVADYSAGTNFASDDTTGTFGVCLQSLASAAPAGTWVADGGTCTAVDSDPWKAVPTAPQTVATAAPGINGTATFVWGMGPRVNQPPGVYRAGIVFEAIAPAT